MSAMPNTLPLNIGQIPAELTRITQWVGWRWRRVGDEWTKVPVNPLTGELASHADPRTWGSFEDATNAADQFRLSGIGFVFHQEDPYTGIDLDDCIDTAGEIADWAWDIVEAANSYAEISPSGTGIKIFVKAVLPGSGRKKPEIEMYDRLRFFTVTGQRVDGVPQTIAERGDYVSRLYRRTFPEKVAKVTPIRPVAPPSLDDREIIDRASSAKNGDKFQRLFSGDTSGYGSQSEADAALVSLIAFYTGPDEGRIDQIFRQSALYRPKWEREDYRASTITLGCDRAEFWEPQRDTDPVLVFDKVAADREGNEDAEREPAFPYLVQVADGLKEPRKPDAWLVEGILRDESVQLIVGPPKTYKSFFAQELSIAVATGTAMFGQFSTGEPRRVLYVQEESARSHLWARYEGILNGRGMHSEVLRDQLWAITNQGVRLDDDAGIERLLREGIEAVEPHLVIFDPLRELHWQDENKAEAMMPILRVFKTLRDRYKVSVAIIHHNNKNPLYTSPADSIRGTSAIWAAVDGGVFIGATEEDKVMKVGFVLKEGGQTPPFLYSIKDAENGIQFNVIDIESSASKAKFDRMQVVAWARERGEWFSIEDALGEFPRGERIIRDAVRDLVRASYLIERPARFGKKEYAHPEVDDDATF